MFLRKWLAGLIMVSMLMIASVPTALAVGGAAFTTYNAHIDGSSKNICANSDINCNLYGAKEYVWLNGGPDANILKPDGDYFFVVLVPGGQPNPNDGGVKNLSDDYDAYTNRTFTVTGGEVGSYTGTHWLDSGKGKPGVLTNTPPYIRLFPYADTTNPGGVYIMAICSLAEGYPVDPRDCKYDAFKVVKGQQAKQFNFLLSGQKFNDYDRDSVADSGEPGLAGWTISINGTGAYGEAINTTATTDADGYWTYTSQAYQFSRTTGAQQPVNLTICEQNQTDWVQSPILSAPASQEANVATNGTCYTVTIPAGGADVAMIDGLDFANSPRGNISGGKYYDWDKNGQYDAGEAWLSGWTINSYTTGADGMFSAASVLPGTYTYAEVQRANGWSQTGNTVDQSSASGGASVILNADKTYTVVISQDAPSSVSGLYFGNVCEVRPGIGGTPGFWHNQNGQALITEADLAELRALNLVNEDGSAFDPTTKEQVANWLRVPAINMAAKLSNFVAADTLNINYGRVNGSTLVYVGGTYNQYMTIEQVLVLANDLLGQYPVTNEGDPGRAEQTIVKDILDAVANAALFVQPAPGAACN